MVGRGGATNKINRSKIGNQFVYMPKNRVGGGASKPLPPAQTGKLLFESQYAGHRCLRKENLQAPRDYSTTDDIGDRCLRTTNNNMSGRSARDCNTTIVRKENLQAPRDHSTIDDIGDRCLRTTNNNMSGRSARSSNSLDHLFEENFRNEPYNLNDDNNMMNVSSDGEIGQTVSPRFEDLTTQSSSRKRKNKFAGRASMCLDTHEIADAQVHMIEHEELNEPVQPSDHSVNIGNLEATSKMRKKGQRGKYKAYVIDMKIRGQNSKLKINMPDEIDRAIGNNARHLVNECGRLVRTRAPLNVKNWEAIAISGDSKWKEIMDKFEVHDSKLLKMQAFVVDTMQRLYRLWKARLHSYYKSEACGRTDEERLNNPSADLPKEQWGHCVTRFSSLEFKKMSERNSKNRLSDKRCTHTTGNLSFAEVEDILTKENINVKPSADVIWLAEHSHKNKEGKLEWADHSRSKDIHLLFD